MKNVRIGKDIAISWTIQINGVAENLAGKDISVTLTDPQGKEFNIDAFTISNNKISFALRGTSFTQLGRYTLTAWLNKGKTGQAMVDEVDAFNLVKRTNLE